MRKEKGYLLSNNGLSVIGKSGFELSLCFITSFVLWIKLIPIQYSAVVNGGNSQSVPLRMNCQRSGIVT